jgi:hypothetical protein
MREAELLTDIAHPSVPRVRAHFVANGTGYLVLQHYDGRTLSDRTVSSVPVQGAAGLVMELLRGLQALHVEGIVHGYVAPENVLITRDSRPVLLGLGTTRHVLGRTKEPVAGFAPIEEYASKDLGPWTDVYACGALLYQLITGAPPPSAVDRAAGQSLTLARSTAPDIPPVVGRVMMSALAHLPDGRPHSAEEFCRRLEAAVAADSLDTVPRLEQRARDMRGPSLSDAPADREASNPTPVLLPEPELPDANAGLPLLDLLRDYTVRLPRRSLALGAAVVLTLLGLTITSRRGAGSLAAGDVVAAQQTPTPRTQSADANVHAAQPNGFAVGTAPASYGQRPPTAVELERRASALVPAGATRAPSRAPPSLRASSPQPATSGDERSQQATSEPDAPRAGPPPMSVTLPATGLQSELPIEVVSDLRERLMQGKQEAEVGEYARARRNLRVALDRITTLGDRYSGTRTLGPLKQEIEQAATSILAACAAENEVIRKRNGKVLQCE